MTLQGKENVSASAVAEELEELKIEGDLATYKGGTKKDSGFCILSLNNALFPLPIFCDYSL